MRSHRLPALAAAGLAAALLSPVGPASARPVLTHYAFNGVAFGTRVLSAPVGASSGDTANTIVNCTRATGVGQHNNVAASTTSAYSLGALVTDVHTYRDRKGDVGTLSTSKVASFAAGDPSQLQLVITGLADTSRAFHGPRGYGSATGFTFSDIALNGSQAGGNPAGGLLNGPVSTVIKQLEANGPIVIPGLGSVSLGFAKHRAGRTGAFAGGAALKIVVYGPDQTAGGTDDTTLFVGRSYAEINGGARNGVMRGDSYGLHASLLGGLATSSRNIYLPMRCPGTGGRTIGQSLAGLDLANTHQVVAGAISSTVYGKQGQPRGGLTAVTGSRVASVNLGGGQLVIRAVVGRATVWRDAANRLHRRAFQSVGSITANGKTYPAPALGRQLTIPGVASITAPRPTNSPTGMKVTALRVQFLPGTPGETDIDLGNAEAYVHR